MCEKTFAATAKGKAAASPAIAIAVPCESRGAERAPLEEHDRDRFGEDCKRDGRRKRHGGRKLERPRLRGVDRLLLSRDVARGEFGQEDDADARRNEPERKLDHPVRVVEPGDQRGTEGGRLRRDEDEQLHRGIGGDGEEGGPEKAADVRGPARPREPDRHLVTGEGETDDSKLHESGNARRGGKPGGLAARRHSLLQKFEDEKRADQASIDHERSNCRGSEAPLMMKHRGDERGERDSEYERKGQPGVKRREGEGFGISGKARRENECDDAGGDLDEGGKREKGKCRRAQRLPGEEPGFRRAAGARASARPQG